MSTLKNLKQYIKNDQDRINWELGLFNTIREYTVTKEGKKYDKRYLDGLKVIINEKYGKDNIYYVVLGEIASMLSVEIRFNKPLKEHYRSEFRYFVSYLSSDGKVINMESFDEKNICWSLDEGRSLDLSQLLQGDSLKQIAKATDKFNKALEELGQVLSVATEYPKYSSWEYDYKRDFLDQDLLSSFQMDKK